jgi:hypothetical protein
VGGSTLSAGVINGFNSGAIEFGGGSQTSVYAGATVNTPLSALKVGASVDFLKVHDHTQVADANGDGEFSGDGSVWDTALYASFQATEKLSLNLRGEFLDDSADVVVDSSELGLNRAKIVAATATASYDLWKNVVSRVEFRWDHGCNGQFFGGTAGASVPSLRNAYMLAAQFIYKF